MTTQFEFFDSDDIGPRRGPTFPEGVRYQPELIRASDEAALLARVRELPFRDFEFHGYTGKRRVCFLRLALRLFRAPFSVAVPARVLSTGAAINGGFVIAGLGRLERPARSTRGAAICTNTPPSTSLLAPVKPAAQHRTCHLTREEQSMSTDRENEMEKMSNWDGREMVIGALGRRVLATHAGPVRFEPVPAAREPLRVTGPSGATIDLFVHVAGPRTPKGWQIDLSYIDRVPERPTWWALVRVESRSSRPTIALVPDGWVRDNIRRHHAAYVAGYPNDERPITPGSPHHTLEFWRVAEWVGRWEEIDRALGVTPPSPASGAPLARRSAAGEPSPKSITG